MLSGRLTVHRRGQVTGQVTGQTETGITITRARAKWYGAPCQYSCKQVDTNTVRTKVEERGEIVDSLSRTVPGDIYLISTFQFQHYKKEFILAFL